MIDETITELTPMIGVKAACEAVGRPRATHYRHHRLSPPPAPPAVKVPARQPRALSEAEEQVVLDVLHSERFVDMAPAEIHAILLDEGVYFCSVSTMYRLLARAGEVRERRRQATHPARVKPELVATGPNQVWSWDITKLHGPVKWSYFYLYSIIDIFSRYIVGWMIATAESAALAERLLADTIRKQHVDRGQLTIHADNGSSMASKPVAFLLADLGITKTHSRPHVSNDTRTPKHTSRPSSTGPISRRRSGPSKTPAPSAPSSTPGTTPPTGTPGSVCTPRPISTTAEPPLSTPTARTSSPTLTQPTRNDSSDSRPSHTTTPRPPGSTHQPTPQTQQSTSTTDPKGLTPSAGRKDGLDMMVEFLVLALRQTADLLLAPGLTQP